jgi:acetyl esterase/lipase
MASEQLAMIVDMMKAMRPATEPSVQEARASLDALTVGFNLPDDVKAEPIDAGGVQAEWITTPESDGSERTILYLHGGGYVIGSIRTHRDLASRVSRAAQARVLLIDYRLAPEHPHPAAVEDALAAYRWLLAQGVDPSRLAVGGDSAGGGLTVATLVALRDANDPLPAAGVCLSPWVDLEGLGESMTTKAGADPMVQRDRLLGYARHYLAGQPARTPLAAPLYADLSGLPPLLIQVGTAETLLDDSTRLAERARKAGVAAELEIWDDMIHVWQAFAAVLPEGQQAIEGMGRFLRLHLG